jgi:RNA polymerase primary sigma factor
MPKIVLEKARFRVLGPLILQLRFEPSHTLLEQSFRAEHLIKLIDATHQYPYDFICYKLTDFKPKEIREPLLISGADIIVDLVIFISHVSRQLMVGLDQLPEPAISVKQLAKEFDISPKTFKRWNKLGLVHRSIIGPEGVAQNFILKNTWQWFITKHERLVARAAAFSRLTVGQREWIISQARKLYQSEKLSRNQIETTLAGKIGRARETVRYVIHHHDTGATAQYRVFPPRAKLTPETCTEIFEIFVRGVPIDQLARIYGRSRPTIYRIVNNARQETWRNLTIEYIFSPEFDLPSADQSILPATRIRIDVIPDSSHLETLTPADERSLFRAYNYLKWKQDQIRKPFYITKAEMGTPPPIPAGVLDELETLQATAEEIKSKLILANQALVVSIAKRHINIGLTLDELLSEGLVPLMKSVEKFDYTRGFKFSTYASWAVMKHFARIVPLANQQQHELLSQDDLDALLPGVAEFDEAEAYRRSMAVQGALEHLTDRERHILENRFGLDRAEEPLSLSQLGTRLGVTKERIRQIESKAMEKLHAILKEVLPNKE